jgi:hypothetical protein
VKREEKRRRQRVLAKYVELPRPEEEEETGEKRMRIRRRWGAR